MLENGMMYHCCIGLDKLLELTLKGNMLLNVSEVETYQLIKELKSKGFKYFSGCDNIDTDGRCAGHLVGVEIGMKIRYVQACNPKTMKYVKMDRQTGSIIAHKKSKGAYRNIKIVGVRYDLGGDV